MTNRFKRICMQTIICHFPTSMLVLSLKTIIFSQDNAKNIIIV